MSARDVERTIRDFATAAELAREAGYDGVEIMGSEGYLINEFLAPRTNGSRTDEWGGASFENRARFARRIVRDVRAACGTDEFAVVFRLSLVELVDDGLAFDEAVALARLLAEDGVDVVNTGIGWHEARVPTIATCVPRAAFAFATHRLKHELAAQQDDARDGDAAKVLPKLCATNRINDVAVVEKVLNEGADLVSMARPFLADADIVAKAFVGDEAATNTCIACNQACLDHTFKLLPVSCLVNPRAAHETSLNLQPTNDPCAIAVVGAGVAGLACATALAERGHRVTLFEAADAIGGQFRLAAQVPGKGEFLETLRYFAHRCETLGVDVRLSTPVSSATSLVDAHFDKVVVATGVRPRDVALPALSSTTTGLLPRVRSYAEVLAENAAPCGPRVAVVGAGGIGFDVAEFLVHDASASFYDEWGIDTELRHRGGLQHKHEHAPPPRQVYLLQRKATPHGASLGKTTGWIHRAALRNKAVTMLGAVEYVGLEPGALVVDVPGAPRTRLEVDDVVLCAGQLSNTALVDELKTLTTSTNAKAPAFFVIGGAERAGELDAKRAIDQGVRLAANIDDAATGAVFTMPTGWKAGVLDFLQTNFSPAPKSSSSKTKAASSPAGSATAKQRRMRAAAASE